LDDYGKINKDSLLKDSLLLDKEKVESYDSLLNWFIRASITELENQEANKDRHLLDGVYFIFTIVSKSGSRKAYANSPDVSSHPLIYELLTKTFDIYRDTNNSTS
jgi:hypothetical protein